MAQEIMVAGAIYEDVPSVRLPDSNGVFHPFTDTSDTTAVAADVAQGKTFHLADGSAATGTAAGATLVTKSITANGTYSAEDDDADGYSEVTVNVSGGGGASNVVTGTFTARHASTSLTITTVDIPYTGSGYPVLVALYVHGGTNNPSNTGWYNVADRYKVGVWTAVKEDSNAPSGGKASYSVTYLFKNSASPWNTYAYSGGSNTVYWEGGNPTAGNSSTGNATRAAVMDGPTTLKVATRASSSYSFESDTEYDYCIVYSE